MDQLLATTAFDATALALGVVCQLHSQAFLLSRALKFASLAHATSIKSVVGVTLGTVVGASGVFGLGVAVLTDTLGNFESLRPSGNSSAEFVVFLPAW